MKQKLEKAIVETQHKYKDIYKQQVVVEKVHSENLIENTLRKLAWDSLRKNTIIDGGIMIDKRTVEVLNHEFDYAFCKEKF